MKIGNVPLGAGLGAFLLVYLGIFAFSNALLVSLMLALCVAVGVTLIAHGLVPSGDSLDEYRIDARKRVKKLLDKVDEIKRLSRDIRDPGAKQALSSVCEEIVPSVLKYTQQFEPTRVASTAAKLGVQLDGALSSAKRYLEFQDDPIWRNKAPALLQNGKKGFVNFEQVMLESAQKLREGDVRAYERDLEAMTPLELQLPELSQGE